MIRSIVIGYLIVLCAGFAHAQGGSSLNIQGTEYKSACSPGNRKKLQQSVKRMAGKTRDPNGAWRLVETLLCASYSKTSRNYLTSILPPKIRTKSSGTGQDDTSELIRTDSKLIRSLLENGKAWDATISSESTGIVLSYYPNEACVNSRTLKFTNKRWRIVEIGGACD